ncbi:MAG TPA: hypothetical protein VLE22_02420, partial [Bryobacteraceae bacterium]|nr:hypothetical protein [Bryobacteraceae bacterium]
MARTSPWPTVLGTAALIALPVLAAAQTGQAGSTGSQTPQTPTAQSDKAYPSTAGAAVQHLTEAKQVLDGIPRNAVTGRNATKLNQIRREFEALQRSYSANPSHSGSAHSSSATTTSSKGATGNWNKQLMALDRDLTALLGASSDSTSPETSGATGTSGTSASSPSAGSASSASSSSLDPNVRSQLEEFRKHITEFAAAASGTQAGGEMSSADTTGSTGTSGT